MPSNILVAVGLYIDSFGRVLVQRRPDTAKRGGLWEFPGGKIEAGETMRDGLAREWQEELGLTIRVGEFLTEVAIEFPEGTALLPLFRVYYDELDFPQPTALEGQTVKFMTWDEVSALPCLPSMTLYNEAVREALGCS